MSAPSPKQIDFIRSLVSERQVYLTANKPAWLVAPATIRDASNIISLLKRVPCDPVEVDPAQGSKVNELRALLDSLPTRDASFASSLIGQFDVKGRLSDKQWKCIDDLLARISSPSAPSKPIEPGLYILDGGVVKVYITQTNRLGAKCLIDQGNGKGAFIYVKGLLSRLTDAQRLTEEQAREFGKQYGFCVACARTLDDDRSLAVGYGPVCASNHDWFYPTVEQASEILGRPASVRHGDAQEIVTVS